MKRIIVAGLCIVFGVIVFSSFENHLTTFAGDCTGATGGTGTCSSSGCHFSSTPSDLNLGIVVTNASDGSIVTGSYIPGNQYSITIKGTHAAGGGGSYHSYGLQFSTGKVNDGEFTPLGGQLNQIVIGTLEYIEHKSPLAPKGTGGVYYENVISWEAPPAGAGNITFYCTMLAANGDHSINGDIERHTSIILTEASVNSVKDFAGIAFATIYPNPAIGEVNLRMDVKEKGDYAITIYNLSGQRVVHDLMDVRTTSFTKQLPVAHLSTGMYFIELRKGNHYQRIQFIKG